MDCRAWFRAGRGRRWETGLSRARVRRYGRGFGVRRRCCATNCGWMTLKSSSGNAGEISLSASNCTPRSKSLRQALAGKNPRRPIRWRRCRPALSERRCGRAIWCRRKTVHPAPRSAPSLPWAISTLALFLTRPYTLTVSLTDCGWMMSRRPLGRLVLNGFSVRRARQLLRELWRPSAGSLTSASWRRRRFLAAKAFRRDGLAGGLGREDGGDGVVEIQILAATRLTSATVTRRMAAISSSGDLRSSTATAWDHAMARPDDGIFLQFGADDFAALGGFHQIGQ